jgi:uncharacterized protein
MTDDPEIINSRHNGRFSRGGISVEVCIYRLEHTKWSLEIVDNNNNSVVWDGEFETDDEAFEEFMRAVRTEGLDVVLRSPSRQH